MVMFECFRVFISKFRFRFFSIRKRSRTKSGGEDHQDVGIFPPAGENTLQCRAEMARSPEGRMGFETGSGVTIWGCRAGLAQKHENSTRFVHWPKKIGGQILRGCLEEPRAPETQRRNNPTRLLIWPGIPDGESTTGCFGWPENTMPLLEWPWNSGRPPRSVGVGWGEVPAEFHMIVTFVFSTQVATIPQKEFNQVWGPSLRLAVDFTASCGRFYRQQARISPRHFCSGSCSPPLGVTGCFFFGSRK